MKRRGTRFEALPGFPLAEMEAARTKLEAEGVDVILLPGGTLGAAKKVPSVSRSRSPSSAFWR